MSALSFTSAPAAVRSAGAAVQLTEAPPWPSEAVSELIVMQCVSTKTSGLGSKTSAPDEACGATAQCLSAPWALSNHPMPGDTSRPLKKSLASGIVM